MNEVLWCLIFACIFILYLCDRWAKRRIEMWVRRRRDLSSNNVVVLPISSRHALPSSAASIPNFSSPQQPAESVEEDNYEILIFVEGSEREKSSINEENDCAICLSEFLKGEQYGVLPACSHKFHADCIMIWLVRSVNKTCPICRTQV
ncbi:hypothetical protein AABB24_027356 [Solanum stoloniferum]|uniref:RING-type E3 ubiquitin transferase n=1 Tax=Solanum stoloniferum TaxID=62892 RepID=A0ABD2SIT6_9SOLN